MCQTFRTVPVIKALHFDYSSPSLFLNCVMAVSNAGKTRCIGVAIPNINITIWSYRLGLIRNKDEHSDLFIQADCLNFYTIYSFREKKVTWPKFKKKFPKEFLISEIMFCWSQPFQNSDERMIKLHAGLKNLINYREVSVNKLFKTWLTHEKAVVKFVKYSLFTYRSGTKVVTRKFSKI